MHITSTEGEQLDTVEEDKKVLKDISIFFYFTLSSRSLTQSTQSNNSNKNVYKKYFILYSFQVWRVCFYALMSNFALSPSTKAAENTREHVPLSTDPHRHAS